MKWFTQIFAVYVCSFSHLVFAERGIVVSVNDGFAEKYFLASLGYLREGLDCTLPIEIWHDGDELSREMMEKLSRFSDVTFRDYQQSGEEYCKNFRGWHSKPFMLKHTRFSEVCLMDADVYFFVNPETVFFCEEYRKTGAFFFRDRLVWFPCEHLVDPLETFLQRRGLFRLLVDAPSKFVPEPFCHVWKEQRIPTFTSPLLGEFQEAGCLFMNREQHREGIDIIVNLTLERDYIYQYVLGDKETYWIGLEVAKEPYTFNEMIPCIIRSNEAVNTMIHFVKGIPFYQQKQPIQVDDDAWFTGSADTFGEEWSRNATRQEIECFQQLYTYYKLSKEIN